MANNLYNTMYNPDVLSCIANLSNDEVFTPPEVANAMLDLLPQELFSDPNTTFLDPACKSGVFLREIAKRLLKGLEPLYPELQERTDHIFKKQLFGISITELTSHLSRRSLYCSKFANGKYSVAHFDNIDGNVRFKNIKHTWGKTTYDAKGKPHTSCVFCGANKEQYDRDESLETHAYEMIHTTRPEEIFKMKFDVIIGNPPYQLSTGGGQAQATPLYDKFVLSAIKLNPRYLTMIIPARWYAGGFPCIKSFREEITSKNQISEIHDFANAGDCFTGVEIKGGVCYFLWERNHNGPCDFYNHEGGEIVSKDTRMLLETGCDTVIRDNEAIEILHKVRNFCEKPFSDIVGTLWPFTTKSSFDTLTKEQKTSNDVFAYVMKDRGWVRRSEISKGAELIDKYKLLLPRSVGSADVRVDRVKPILAEKNTCCSGTYIICGPFDNKEIAENVQSYINTKFFHFLLALKKVSQDTVRGCYDLIPIQDFSHSWNDAELYKKYKLNEDEIKYIESRVWPDGGDE